MESYSTMFTGYMTPLRKVEDLLKRSKHKLGYKKISPEMEKIAEKIIYQNTHPQEFNYETRAKLYDEYQTLGDKLNNIAHEERKEKGW